MNTYIEYGLTTTVIIIIIILSNLFNIVLDIIVPVWIQLNVAFTFCIFRLF